MQVVCTSIILESSMISVHTALVQSEGKRYGINVFALIIEDIFERINYLLFLRFRHDHVLSTCRRGHNCRYYL